MSEKEQITFHHDISANQLAVLYTKSRVAVAPLMSGAGVKGKVAEAWLQGVPVVATPIAVEGMYGFHEHSYLLGNTSLQFAQQVGRLFDDCILWQHLVKGGYETLKERFSFQVAKMDLIQAVEDARWGTRI